MCPQVPDVSPGARCLPRCVLSPQVTSEVLKSLAVANFMHFLLRQSLCADSGSHIVLGPEDTVINKTQSNQNQDVSMWLQ